MIMKLIIIILYTFVSGGIYTSWLWDTKDPLINKLLNILCGFMNGWYITPFLIGKALAKIYDGK